MFAIGAGLYGLIEILWRSRTHWTMLLCGGACFTFMYFLSAAQLPFRAKCLISAAAISHMELAVGYVVNIILGLAVWDYSVRSLNILGQICPLYSFFWLLLSAPALALCGLIKSRFGL